MSFSVNFTAPTKAEAKRRFAEELAAYMDYQPPHKKDRAVVEVAANAYIDALDDDDTKDVTVNVYGSVQWDGVKYPDYSTVPGGLIGCNLTINIGLATRAPQTL